MAGNGMEWTRPRENQSSLVELRGRSFSDNRPFSFKDRDTKSEFCNKAKSWIGFRLVIEGL